MRAQPGFLPIVREVSTSSVCHPNRQSQLVINVVDIVAELKEYNCRVDVYDPWVSVEEAQREYGITPLTPPSASVA